MQESYDVISKVILEYIKRIGVKTILTNKVFAGELRVFYLNWIGRDDKYYSLLAPCSYSTVYRVGQSDISSSYNSIQAVLEFNTKVFEDTDAWYEGMWKLEYAERYSEELMRQINSRTFNSISAGGYRTVDVHLHVQPMLGMTIWYESVTGKLGNITVWQGTKTTLGLVDDGFIKFLDALGILGNVQCMQQLRFGIGEKNDN